MQTRCEHCKKVFDRPNARFCTNSCRRSFESKKYRKRISEYNKRYYASNTEMYKTLWKKYYAEHKDEILSRSKDRYISLKQTKPELIKLWNKNGSRKYRQTPKGKLSRILDSHRRRSVGKIDRVAWAEKLESFGGRCAECGSSEKITIDHIVPVVKNGTNHITNLQPLCSRCNASKGSKIKDEEKVRHSK